MIQRAWHDPNFRFTAIDENGNQDTWVVYAATAEDLETRLEELDYTDIQIEPYDFQTWQTRAQTAKTRVAAYYQEHKNVKECKLNEALWGELKFHLFELFGGKCAYCEHPAVRVSGWGSVEHYRPKKRVDEDEDHPGYYWLAYEPENFLPSCNLCNEARGKLTKFPVKGQNARKAADLINEQPLLIHPVLEDPRACLYFTEEGKAVPRQGCDEDGQLKAEKSIRTYFLKRPGISSERRKAMQDVKNEINVRSAVNFLSIIKNIRLSKQEALHGRSPYAGAVLDELDRSLQKLRMELGSEEED